MHCQVCRIFQMLLQVATFGPLLSFTSRRCREPLIHRAGGPGGAGQLQTGGLVVKAESVPRPYREEVPLCQEKHQGPLLSDPSTCLLCLCGHDCSFICAWDRWDLYCTWHAVYDEIGEILLYMTWHAVHDEIGEIFTVLYMLYMLMFCPSSQVVKWKSRWMHTVRWSISLIKRCWLQLNMKLTAVIRPILVGCVQTAVNNMTGMKTSIKMLAGSVELREMHSGWSFLSRSL